MLDDPVHHGIVGEEGDDAHLAPAQRAEQWVHLMDFSDHLSPAPAWDPRAFLLNDDEWMGVRLSPAHLTPVSIGIQAEITDSNLPLVWNMGCDPGDELQVIHPLHLGGLLPIPVADLTLPPPFIKGETFQRKQRADHIFTHTLGLFSGFGFDLAVDRETCVAPAENLLQQGKDLVGEDFLDKLVMETTDMVEGIAEDDTDYFASAQLAPHPR